MDNKLEFDMVQFTQWGKDHGFSDETTLVYSEILPWFVRFVKGKSEDGTLDDQVSEFVNHVSQDPVIQDQKGESYISMVRLVLDNFKAWDLYTKEEFKVFQAAHPLKGSKDVTLKRMKSGINGDQ